MSTLPSNSKVYEDGELWSFIRRCMSQGKDIHLDHAERTYEEYSARLDVAALERLPELQAYIVRAVVAARGSPETCEQQPVAWRVKNGFGDWHFTTVKPHPAYTHLWEPLYAAHELKAGEPLAAHSDAAVELAHARGVRVGQLEAELAALNARHQRELDKLALVRIV